MPKPLIWMLLLTFVNASSVIGGEEAPDFEKSIAPILITRCLECHQERNPSGNLVLTTREGLFKGGDSGTVVDLDSPADSYLLERVHAGEMPPEKQGRSQKLPPEERDSLQRWIVSGAAWPVGRKLDLFEQTTTVRAGRDWWSLQPVRRPDVPEITTSPAPENPVDAFVLARLNAVGMVPAPEADKRTLIRRLYYDVIGLPPSREQIDRFVSDDSPDAWNRAVDELLASPHYGERWARYWLDLVRYAETSGYERDQEKPFVWKYRDWVVDALNSDMPYDRFVIEQIAGDEIPGADEQSVIATGMLRLGTWNDEPNDPEDYQYDRLEDLVHTTSSAFLAMTVKCARCHDHKFDPIKQEDYYRMGSAFWAGPIAARGREHLGGPTAEELGYKDVLGWTDLGPNPRPLHVLKNGEREHPLQQVVPASLSMIPELERPFSPPAAGDVTSKRRLQLAEWIARPDNPLTARVLVNRLWLHHFGKGIVRTPNNFGFLADPPTHPQLLDWLAAEFVAGGWTLKHIHKLILTSRTWRQSSLHPQEETYRRTDAGNRLWWRAERRRLDAEALRDTELFATGELDLRLGGPSFRPTISEEALEGLSRKSSAWQASPPSEQNRRSLYIHSKRGLLPPMLTVFDLCDATQPVGQRDVTTVPTQALALLNNRFVHDRSEALAERVGSRTADPRERVRQVFSAILGRDPSDEEMSLATAHLRDQQARFVELAHRPLDTNPSVAIGGLEKHLVLHLRADRGVTVDETGKVSVWLDQSGRGHHARQPDESRRPSLNPSDLSESPSLRFDGAGTFLQIEGGILDDDECTIVAVVTDRGSPGHREILSNWNSDGNVGTSLFLGLTGEKTVRFSDDFSSAGEITGRDKPLVLTALNGPGGAAVFQNGRKIAGRSNRLAQRKLETEWIIGQQGNINGEFWNGEIAEVRVYSKALSEDIQRQVESELFQSYHIPAQQTTKREPTPEVLALASLCHVLLNSNEFLYVD